MGKYSTSIGLNAPQETVWAFLNDLDRNPDWVSNVRQVVSVSEGPVGMGTIFRERIRVLGPFHAEGEWRITRFKPPALHEHQGPVPITGHTTVRYTLEPAAAGCTCSVEISYLPSKRLLARIADLLFVRPGLALSFRRNLRKMKRLIEVRRSAG